ncbi:MAG: hypothetical protein LBT86_02780 [Deltaproteobacteria bacterium]|jgi:hypothetical protein|nr:hypothetical protein [Deltaproteobacteria bacterium]
MSFDNDSNQPRQDPSILLDLCLILSEPDVLSSVNAGARAFYDWIQTSAAMEMIKAKSSKNDILTIASVLLTPNRK